jgi:hypothetical protein
MSGYIGATPVPQSIQTKQTFTATASQTTFGTTGYSDGTLVDVHLNGVLLVGGGVDYTATNGSDIVLTTGASAGDTLEFSTFSALQLSDQVFNNSITLQNPTEEDTDGGRESTLIFKGEQSGGEKTTLAEIEASHDGTADDQKGDLIFRTNDGSDGSAPTEAVRIDSAQNLLVGKTETGFSSEGHVLFEVGAAYHIRDDNIVGYFNRKTSDGDIVGFYKDGSEVGSIASHSGSFLKIQSTGNQSGTLYGTSAHYPLKNDALSDDDIDLGGTSNRFKDLYLSGGAYLGGTVAANKLDDYEEGTWTPNVAYAYSSPTYNIQVGKYTKVGNLVTAYFFIDLTSSTTSSLNAKVQGFPFTSANNTNVYITGSGYVNSSSAKGLEIKWLLFPNSTEARLYEQTATGVTTISSNTTGSTPSMLFSFTYYTD